MKLYAILIEKRLTKHLEAHDLRCHEQTAFRKGFSTLHPLFTLQHFIDMATPQKPLYVCKLDLSKAYDRVPRELLWEALRRVGIQGQCLQAIKSLYEDALLRVAAGQTFGDEYKPQAGITQGSPLSPLLWCLFADGLIRYVQARCPNIGPMTRDKLRVCILMFADDIKLLATSSEDLQTLLDVVKEWCDLLNMIVNAIKTQVLIFPAPREPQPMVFRYNGGTLEVVPSTKYLGVQFSSQKGMGETFSILHGKMWGAWTSIRRKYGNLKSAVSIGLLLRLFQTCVVPAGSYACELWSVREFTQSTMGVKRKDLEKAFSTMVRMLVGANNHINNDILFRELDVHPLNHQWLNRVVTFWNSLVQLPDSHIYARILKDSCYYGVTSRAHSWAGSVMQALRAIGYPYIIDCNQAYPIDLEVYRSVFQKHEARRWEGLHVSPRLAPSTGIHRCTYVRWFARRPNVSKHKLLYLPMSSRKLRKFIQFRVGQHDLPIATGRWRGIPRYERFCDMCHMRLVGDEQHFVFYCPAMQSVRDQYPDLFQSQTRSLRQFVWQMDTPRVVNFIVDCFAKRALLH